MTSATQSARSEGSSRRPWIWVAALFGLSFALFLTLFIVVGPKEMLTSVYFNLTEDTEFSPGYSEEKFNAIALGDSESSVLAALGKPFREGPAKPHTGWLYCATPHSEYAEKEDTPVGSYTAVTFDEEGALESVFGCLQTSGSGSSPFFTSTFISGSGYNTLGLTDDEIKTLIQADITMEEFRIRFGEPQELHESKRVRWLSFSRSPGSHNYALRTIGLDREGRVCDIRSDRYWD